MFQIILCELLRRGRNAFTLLFCIYFLVFALPRPTLNLLFICSQYGIIIQFRFSECAVFTLASSHFSGQHRFLRDFYASSCFCCLPSIHSLRFCCALFSLNGNLFPSARSIHSAACRVNDVPECS